MVAANCTLILGSTIRPTASILAINVETTTVSHAVDVGQFSRAFGVYGVTVAATTVAVAAIPVVLFLALVAS